MQTPNTPSTSHKDLGLQLTPRITRSGYDTKTTWRLCYS